MAGGWPSSQLSVTGLTGWAMAELTKTASDIRTLCVAIRVVTERELE
jgi:hypothetical protein